MLVTEVVYVKHGDGKTFVIVDAAMNDLIRPTLYEAHHDVKPVHAARRRIAPHRRPTSSGRCAKPAIISLSGREMAEPQAGDLLAVMTAGRLRRGAGRHLQLAACWSPRCWSTGAAFAVVRPRPTYEELIGLDRLPPWLRRGHARRVALGRRRFHAGMERACENRGLASAFERATLSLLGTLADLLREDD